MPERQHLHRLSRVWIRPTIFFLTICTAGRRKILDHPEIADLLLSAWCSAPTVHGWIVGRYVVMPDHVHFFATANSAAKSLSAFIRDWKKWTARQLVEQRLASAPVWQAEFFDHLLRSIESYSQKWDYVRENPVRAGLVSRAENWPFAGECETIRFH